jgi:hypothetical protein
LQVGEIQPGGDAVAVEVERDGDDVEVAGALAVAEKRALDAVAPASRPSSVAATPVPRSLWVCSEMMADSRFRRFRHIHSIWSACTFGVVHSTVAGRLRMIFFSGVGCQTSITAWQHSSEKSSSVSEKDSGEYCSTTSVRHGGDEFLHQPRAFDGDVADRLARGVGEGDAALQRRGRVIDMHDGAPRSLDRLEGAPDQVLARLHQHLDRHVLGDAVLLDQAAQEVELGVRRGRETDLDLLEADAHQQIEKLQFLLDRHRLWQRLVAIAQIDRAPLGRVVEHLVRPGAVGQEAKPVQRDGNGPRYFNSEERVEEGRMHTSRRRSPDGRNF